MSARYSRGRRMNDSLGLLLVGHGGRQERFQDVRQPNYTYAAIINRRSNESDLISNV